VPDNEQTRDTSGVQQKSANEAENSAQGGAATYRTRAGSIADARDWELRAQERLRERDRSTAARGGGLVEAGPSDQSIKTVRCLPIGARPEAADKASP